MTYCEFFLNDSFFNCYSCQADEVAAAEAAEAQLRAREEENRNAAQKVSAVASRKRHQNLQISPNFFIVFFALLNEYQVEPQIISVTESVGKNGETIWITETKLPDGSVRRGKRKSPPPGWENGNPNEIRDEL